MIHRECRDCGNEYKIDQELADMAVLTSGMSREQTEQQCPVCDSMNTEAVEK
jgi:Zn finger protein HypA/HybF involved in hydrogenase expression